MQRRSVCENNRQNRAARAGLQQGRGHARADSLRQNAPARVQRHALQAAAVWARAHAGEHHIRRHRLAAGRGEQERRRGRGGANAIAASLPRGAARQRRAQQQAHARSGQRRRRALARGARQRGQQARRHVSDGHGRALVEVRNLSRQLHANHAAADDEHASRGGQLGGARAHVPRPTRRVLRWRVVCVAWCVPASGTAHGCACRHDTRGMQAASRQPPPARFRSA
jgi:hypothetical protein